MHEVRQGLGWDETRPGAGVCMADRLDLGALFLKLRLGIQTAF